MTLATTCVDHAEAALLLEEAAHDMAEAAADWGILARAVPDGLDHIAAYIASRQQVAARASRILMQQLIAARDGSLDLDRADAYLDAATAMLDRLEGARRLMLGVIA